MSATLEKAAVAFVPVAIVFGYSIVSFARARTVPVLLQLLGSAGLLVVVLAHVAEAMRLLPAMGWGRPNSAGHYIDLVSAILGCTLLASGIALRLIRARS